MRFKFIFICVYEELEFNVYIPLNINVSIIESGAQWCTNQFNVKCETYIVKIRIYPSLFPRLILIEQRQEMPQVKPVDLSSS